MVDRYRLIMEYLLVFVKITPHVKEINIVRFVGCAAMGVFFLISFFPPVMDELCLCVVSLQWGIARRKLVPKR